MARILTRPRIAAALFLASLAFGALWVRSSFATGSLIAFNPQVYIELGNGADRQSLYIHVHRLSEFDFLHSDFKAEFTSFPAGEMRHEYQFEFESGKSDFSASSPCWFTTSLPFAAALLVTPW